uniref:Uncharacterized protein n=1 Tax=viral metagenome TaxID=1070528 RepID=A0A6C0K4K5_9ZZZZ
MESSIFLDRIYNVGADINHWMKECIKFTTTTIGGHLPLNSPPVREHEHEHEHEHKHKHKEDKEEQHEVICRNIHDIWAFRRKYKLTDFCVCEDTGTATGKALRFTGTLKPEVVEEEESECDSDSTCGGSSAGGTFNLLMSDDEFEGYPLSDDECS